MGIGASDFSRESESHVSWLVEHVGYASPWSSFTLRRYGAGYAATGVESKVAVPRLLRRRLHDWRVKGCGVHVGSNFVSFGRQLVSLSSGTTELFFGIDIFFGDTSARAQWLWYCSVREWLLHLHKAVLEPMPPRPSRSPILTTRQQQWAGRPRLLGDEPSTTSTSEPLHTFDAAGDSRAGGDSTHVNEEESNPPLDETIDHQLSLFLSNADGHVGILCLPIPNGQVDAVAAVVAKWRSTCEEPLVIGERRWETEEDFLALRDARLNMPDLLLLGLEMELSMVLTPDVTWEKYPHGLGNPVSPRFPSQTGEEGEQQAEATDIDDDNILATSSVPQDCSSSYVERGELPESFAEVFHGGNGGSRVPVGDGNGSCASTDVIHDPYEGAAGLGLVPRGAIRAA
jgi:hypothetical protein